VPGPVITQRARERSDVAARAPDGRSCVSMLLGGTMGVRAPGAGQVLRTTRSGSPGFQTVTSIAPSTISTDDAPVRSAT
jgi:hypothetical protein